MVEINWTHEAEIWLRDIHTYIAVDNPNAVQRTIAGIIARAKLLRTNPRLGYRYHAETSREIRILLYGHYRIAYLIQSETNIDILGVFHGSLSIERYLV